MRNIFLLLLLCFCVSLNAQKTIIGDSNNTVLQLCDTLTGEIVLVEKSELVDDCCYDFDGTNFVKRPNCDNVGLCKDNLIQPFTRTCLEKRTYTVGYDNGLTPNSSSNDCGARVNLVHRNTAFDAVGFQVNGQTYGQGEVLGSYTSWGNQLNGWRDFFNQYDPNPSSTAAFDFIGRPTWRYVTITGCDPNAEYGTLTLRRQSDGCEFTVYPILDSYVIDRIYEYALYNYETDQKEVKYCEWNGTEWVDIPTPSDIECYVPCGYDFKPYISDDAVSPCFSEIIQEACDVLDDGSTVELAIVLTDCGADRSIETYTLQNYITADDPDDLVPYEQVADELVDCLTGETFEFPEPQVTAVSISETPICIDGKDGLRQLCKDTKGNKFYTYQNENGKEMKEPELYSLGYCAESVILDETTTTVVEQGCLILNSISSQLCVDISNGSGNPTKINFNTNNNAFTSATNYTAATMATTLNNDDPNNGSWSVIDGLLCVESTDNEIYRTLEFVSIGESYPFLPNGTDNEKVRVEAVKYISNNGIDSIKYFNPDASVEYTENTETYTFGSACDDAVDPVCSTISVTELVLCVEIADDTYDVNDPILIVQTFECSVFQGVTYYDATDPSIEINTPPSLEGCEDPYQIVSGQSVCDLDGVEWTINSIVDPSTGVPISSYYVDEDGNVGVPNCGRVDCPPCTDFVNVDKEKSCAIINGQEYSGFEHTYYYEDSYSSFFQPYGWSNMISEYLPFCCDDCIQISECFSGRGRSAVSATLQNGTVVFPMDLVSDGISNSVNDLAATITNEYGGNWSTATGQEDVLCGNTDFDAFIFTNTNTLIDFITLDIGDIEVTSYGKCIEYQANQGCGYFTGIKKCLNTDSENSDLTFTNADGTIAIRTLDSYDSNAIDWGLQTGSSAETATVTFIENCLSNGINPTLSIQTDQGNSYSFSISGIAADGGGSTPDYFIDEGVDIPPIQTIASLSISCVSEQESETIEYSNWISCDFQTTKWIDCDGNELDTLQYANLSTCADSTQVQFVSYTQEKEQHCWEFNDTLFQGWEYEIFENGISVNTYAKEEGTNRIFETGYDLEVSCCDYYEQQNTLCIGCENSSYNIVKHNTVTGTLDFLAPGQQRIFVSGSTSLNYTGNDIATAVDFIIEWGDGSSDIFPNAVPSSGAITGINLFQHTYTNFGTYYPKGYFISDSGLRWEANAVIYYPTFDGFGSVACVTPSNFSDAGGCNATFDENGYTVNSSITGGVINPTDVDTDFGLITNIADGATENIDGVGVVGINNILSDATFTGFSDGSEHTIISLNQILLECD